ncbi:MAG: hypothetical protein WKF59_03515 [Chitinophagaceae bacterium]
MAFSCYRKKKHDRQTKDLLLRGWTLKQSAANRYQQWFRLPNKAKQKSYPQLLDKTKLQFWAGRYKISRLQQYLNER